MGCSRPDNGVTRLFSVRVYFQKMRVVLRQSNIFYVFTFLAAIVKTDFMDLPKFGESITNVTVPVGREAIMGCVVEDLGAYKVAWLRVDTQTILTIANHVITKNHRIGVTHRDRRTWFLHIKEVRESDRGWYMCQINTDPMKSQVGYMEIVVPPDILDYPTSTDMVAREGSNVIMKCAAKGTPEPKIIWKREGGDVIPIGHGVEVASVDGSVFNISRVSRLHMGAYLCIAYNGVPPSVSKRITLIVHFPPMIWIQNQLVGAVEGQEVTLECHSEAYPKSINYWTGDRGDIIAQGNKYEPQLVDNAYKVHMKLIIKSVSLSDFGTYKCVSKNSLGHTDGSIKLYQVSKDISHTTRYKGKKHDSNEIGLDLTGEYKESRDNKVDSPEAEESTSSSPIRRIVCSDLLVLSVLLYVVCACGS